MVAGSHGRFCPAMKAVRPSPAGAWCVMILDLGHTIARTTTTEHVRRPERHWRGPVDRNAMQRVPMSCSRGDLNDHAARAIELLARSSAGWR